MSEKDLVSDIVQKEKEQNDLIDEWIRNMSEFKVDTLEIWKQIRQYRQEIFEIKMKIKDLNNAYENLDLKNVKLSVDSKNDYDLKKSKGINPGKIIAVYAKEDYYNTIMEILTYYGRLLEHFRQYLLEEKMLEVSEEKKEDDEFMLE